MDETTLIRVCVWSDPGMSVSLKARYSLMSLTLAGIALLGATPHLFGAQDMKARLDLTSVRRAFVRGEVADLPITIINESEADIEKASVQVDVQGLIRGRLDAGPVARGSSAMCRFRLDTRALKAGEYAVRCDLLDGDRPVTHAGFVVWVARRWNPERMRVWLWPHTKFGIYVTRLDDEAKRQLQWYADKGFNSFVPHGFPEPGDRSRAEVFDYALVNGWEMGFFIDGGLDPKSAPEDALFQGHRGPVVDPFHPEVARRQNEKNRRIMEMIREFPGVRLCFFNSEQGDARMFLETPRARALALEYISDSSPHRFVAPGVIPDDDEGYVKRLYSLKWGDGLAAANERGARMVHAYRPDVIVFTDPCRQGAIYERFRGMDLISTWTYTNPDPKYMLFIETMIAMAKYAGQGVMQTVTLLNYPGTIAPKEKGWTIMGPDRLVETNWINLSRRPDGLAMYLSSDCDPFDTAPPAGTDVFWQPDQKEPYQRYPKTFEALKRFVDEVVRPYGPMISRLERTPRRVAVLSSEVSRLYSDSPGYASYYDNYAIYEFYILLNMIHVPADVIFDETVLRHGLDGYDVVVLPKCETLLEGVYKQLLDFVKRGGVVVADQYLRADIPGAIRFDFDFTYRNKVSANALVENKDYAQWDDHLDPNSAELRTVKGVTALNDQKIMESYAAMLRRGLEGKVRREVDCSSPTALLNMLQKGPARYLFVINDNRTYDDARFGEYRAILEKAVPQTVTITLAEWPHPQLFVYDMIERKALPTRARDSGSYEFDVELPAPGGKIIALLPQRLAGIEIRLPGRVAVRGVEFPLQVLISAEGGAPAPGVQPLHVTVTDPQGNRSEFSDYYAAESGVATIGLTPAINDLPGTWVVRADDLISGMTCERKFVLEP